jgi:hypothetical protein
MEWKTGCSCRPSTTLLRAMPVPSTPEARNLRREAQALIE